MLPNHESLLTRLSQISILLSRSISRRWSLCQNGKECTVDQEAGNLHFEATQEQIRLYLPRNGAERDMCLKTKVPKRLMKYFEIDEPGSEAILNSIINLQYIRSVVNALQDDGIVTVDGLEAPQLPEQDDDSDTESELRSAFNSALVLTPDTTPRPSPAAARASIFGTWTPSGRNLLPQSAGSKSEQQLHDSTP